VAHVLVDRATGVVDDLRQPGEKTVDEAGQRLWVELLGDAGEAADIREEQREITDLAAKLPSLGATDQLVDPDRGQVAAEEPTHPPLFLLGPQITEERAGEIDEQDDQGWNQWIDQIVETREAIPGDSDRGRSCACCDQQRPERSDVADGDDQND